MAQPIQIDFPPRDAKKELMLRLESAPTEHAAALLDGYELLQQLHEHGVFSMLRGVLGASDKVVDVVASGANSAEAIRATRNAILLARMLGAIDPDVLQAVTGAVSDTLGDAKTLPQKPPGIFSLLSGFTSIEHRRGVAVFSRLFGNLGARWGNRPGSGVEH